MKIGSAVRVINQYESRYGIGLIVDKNPKYWFVQFPCGQLTAFKPKSLELVSA